MSEINEIKINAASPGEYILRVGESSKIESPRNIKITGTIEAPFAWANKKIIEEFTALRMWSQEYSHIEYGFLNRWQSTFL